jgi:hypothetical protein
MIWEAFMSFMSKEMKTGAGAAIPTHRGGSARAAALAALAVGTASSTAFALIAVLMTSTNITSKDLTFHHAGDYWYTAIGIPTAISSIVLLFALRTLQPTARPGLARAGVLINAAALSVLAVMLAYSVATGAEARWGGTYIVATLATFLAHVLFSAASWRAGLIPRPLLTAWPLVWLIGAFAAQGPSPLLLAAFYLTLGVLIARRR